MKLYEWMHVVVWVGLLTAAGVGLMYVMVFSGISLIEWVTR
jgi:hypothetical protein